MMIQEAGYDPDLIDWAGIDQEIVGRMAEELVWVTFLERMWRRLR